MVSAEHVSLNKIIPNSEVAHDSPDRGGKITAGGEQREPPEMANKGKSPEKGERNHCAAFRPFQGSF